MKHNICLCCKYYAGGLCFKKPEIKFDPNKGWFVDGVHVTVTRQDKFICGYYKSTILGKVFDVVNNLNDKVKNLTSKVKNYRGEI